MNREVESKFEVNEADFNLIKNYLSNVNSIGHFELGAEKIQSIQDHYFDFDDYFFFNQGGSLRVRLSENSSVIKIALKNNGSRTKFGQLDREEIEGEATVEVFNEIIDKINEIKIQEIKISNITFDDLILKGVWGILEEIGTNKVLVAESNRLKRSIELSGIEIGEISLDNVQYKKNLTIQKYFELEIETLSNNLEEIEFISSSIKKKFPNLSFTF